VNCLYLTCKEKAMDCDTFCPAHRAQYGLYRPHSYAEAYAKAKKAHETSGDKYFVYRHNRVGHLHKGYGTGRVTDRNWIRAIFSEVVFPNEGLVSNETAQNMMFTLLKGGQK
jgi:hypothetical protein